MPMASMLGKCGVDNVYAGVDGGHGERSHRRGHSGQGAPHGAGCPPGGASERRPSNTWRSRAVGPSATPPHASIPLPPARERSHGSKTLRLTPGTSSRPLSVTAQKREDLLHKIQQKLYDEALFMPIWELGFLCASGPRAAVSGLSMIPLFAYSGPYEDVQLKS